METAVIAAIIGAIGTALVGIIGAAKKRSQNKKDQLDHEENLIKLSSSMTNVNQAISELRSEIMPILNGLSKDLDRVDRKLESFHSEQKEINIVSLRHQITQVFHTYREDKKIPGPIYTSTLQLYDQYKALGGNSFVSEEVEEMKDWEKI